MSRCLEDGCNRIAFVEGRCEGHDILWMVVDKTVERFWSQVDRRERPSGCWVWTGGRDRYGYGKMTFRRNNRRRYWPAHRFSYMLVQGPWELSSDKVIDHLCRNIRCVNPSHLDLVTAEENTNRFLTLPCPECNLVARHREGCTLVPLGR